MSPVPYSAPLSILHSCIDFQIPTCLCSHAVRQMLSVLQIVTEQNVESQELFRKLDQKAMFLGILSLVAAVVGIIVAVQ
jgi:hypothetical protein